MEDKRSEIGKDEAEISGNLNVVPAKKNNFKWILLIVFIAMIVRIILTPQDLQLQWVDYESGIKIAKQEDKPILIAFYKAGTKFCSEMWGNTYTNENIIKFIEANFVPIMVDVDKQPELVTEYEVGYYPTHFIKTSDNKEIIITKRGYDAPGQFTSFLKEGLNRMDLEPKQPIQ